jgi:hypothetical protein
MYKMLNNIKVWMLAAIVLCLTACGDYLDVVPDDGIPSIETAFNLRSTAIRYLNTCYSYMTEEGASGSDPALLGSDEIWDLYGRTVTNTTGRVPATMFNIARGNQNSSTPFAYDWASMYQGIRCCDILMDGIGSVPDMEAAEKQQWIAEAKFLKAYYHFNLIRRYGPIPIVKKSLPIDASVEQVRVYRDPIDSCFDYVIKLLDEAIPALPLINPSVDEYGRVTRTIAKAFKAKVCVFAASPLFNNNTDEATLVDSRGIKLFAQDKTQEQQQQRWVDAMTACKEAIQTADTANYKLYDYNDLYRVNDTLHKDFTLRCLMTERWNKELIWGNTQSNATQLLMWQQLCCPNLQYKSTSWSHALSCYAFIGVPLKIAEEFYTKNGLPISYDRSWLGVNELELQQGDEDNKYYIEKGYTTCKLNFNREPRFYADLGFDGGKWVGALDNYNDLKAEDIFDVECRMGKALAKSSKDGGPVTGYYPKKMFPYTCRMSATNTALSSRWYPWPMIRLADLYLLYAESINEAEGPSGAHSKEMFQYVDSVRKRAGIPDVKTSWDTYSTSPGFYNTKAGMRAIIHRERMIELAFESQRFWDLRRWKEAPAEYSKNIYGFNIYGFEPVDYYKKVLIYEQPFRQKDYFWPIKKGTIEQNPNLVQNIGW